MNKNARIFVAGASGMVGSAILRRLKSSGYINLLGSTHVRRLPEHDTSGIEIIPLDLMNQQVVDQFFKKYCPEYVFLAAARVGGIHANQTYPAQFIHDNLSMQTHIIHSAYIHHVKRLLFLGSSCIYPGQAPQPLKETHLMTSPLEPTNEPYAIAKIAGIKMCESYNRQYGTQFISVMPTNLYGPNDNFDLKTSHVLPALIRKFHEAHVAGAPEVVVWGTGRPRREFLHVDDMADACVYVMNQSDQVIHETFLSYPAPGFVNVGTGTDCTIKELSQLIKDQVGYCGALVFDTTKPDGTLLKRLDVSRLAQMGWNARISLKDGIKNTYEWFLNQSH